MALTQIELPPDLTKIRDDVYYVNYKIENLAVSPYSSAARRPTAAPGGTVLLDDAARPGERYVARRWKKAWPDFDFRYEGAGTKGLLVGTRARSLGA